MHTYTVVNRVERALHGVLVAAGVAVLIAGCGGGGETTAAPKDVPAFKVASAQFQDGSAIPRSMSCDGAGTSPELSWSGLPAKTREVAVLVDDPDAGGDGFRHWTIWGIDPKTREIPAGAVPPGAKQADNDAGKPGWTGPCPPEGDAPHHYVFSVRALGEPVDAADGADVTQARNAINAATIAKGEITGTYGR